MNPCKKIEVITLQLKCILEPQQRIEKVLQQYFVDSGALIMLSAANAALPDECKAKLTVVCKADRQQTIESCIISLDSESIPDIIDIIGKHTHKLPVRIVQISLQDFGANMLPVALHCANMVCVFFSADLLVCAPNIARKDVALRLMSGGFDDPYHDFVQNNGAFYTHCSMNQLLEDAGFQFVEEHNLELEQNQINDKGNVFLSPGTMLYDHLSYYRDLCDPYANVRHFIRIYRPLPKVGEAVNQEHEEQPFLTVVIRTVGNRIESLREVLLCLTAQDDADFEVLIVGHKMSSENGEAICALIEELPYFLQNRTRLIRVDHGNRSTPLNVGFSQAKGTYIVALDDDDLVTGDWVQSFHDGFREAPGALLHCYCVSQEWSLFQEKEGSQKLLAVAAPSNIFCQPFNWREQYKVNRCPLMTIAFPKDVFHRFPYKFDEKLDTVEDWDYIMTMAMILGVHDIPNVTAIYRLWTNAQNSYSLHNKDEWDRNMAYVLDKLSHIPMMFPRGSLVDKEVGKAIVAGGAIETEIYGEQIGQRHKLVRIKPTEQQHLPDGIVTVFKDLEEYRLHGKIRLDPTDVAHYELTRFSIHATMANGTTVIYEVKDVATNGAKRKNSILFPADDPHIYFTLPKGELASLQVSYTLIWGIPFKKMARFLPNLIGIAARMFFRKVYARIWNYVGKVFRPR